MTDSKAELPLEALLGVPLQVLIHGWEQVEDLVPPSTELLSRVDLLLRVVAWLAPTADLLQLRKAVTENNPRALSALVRLDALLKGVSDMMLTRCSRAAQQKDWATLRREASITARIAGAVTSHSVRAKALLYVAMGSRAEGDLDSTVAVYESAIAAATSSGEEEVLAVAHDNLGNVLTDLGRLDEALGHYDESLKHEQKPEGYAAILNNQARALGMIGELRRAARVLQSQVKVLEQAGVGGQALAYALDNAALQIMKLGDHTGALSMFERAQTLLNPADIEGRLINAQNRADAHMAMEQRQAAEQAFQEAHDLAFEHARRMVDPEHYRRGFGMGRASALPPTDEAHALLVEMVRAKDANEWQQALSAGKLAIDRARNGGDFMLALRIKANVAALLYDQGQVESVIKVANQVIGEASERGLARSEIMALGTLASLSSSGADLHQRLGSLSLYARCVVLLELHTNIVTEFGLDSRERQLETYDPGVTSNELAILSERHGADDLAIRYFQDAVAKAGKVLAFGPLVNRLAGLRAIFARKGQIQEADTVADELASLLTNSDLLPRAQLLGHRALGAHLEDTAIRAAIKHRRDACAILEQLRQQLPVGTARANVDRQFPLLYQELASLLRRSGDDTGAFEALQRSKGRRLIDALTARTDGEDPQLEEAPSVQGISALLSGLSDTPTVLVDLAVERDGLTAYTLKDGHIHAVHLTGNLSTLTSADFGDVRERQAQLVTLCQQDPLLLGLVREVAAIGLEGRHLLIVPDRGLQNFPLHITPIGERPWCEQSSIGYIPAAGVLHYTKRLKGANAQVLVAGDSREDLPHAAAECMEIAALLGTTPLLGANCTRSAIENRMRAGSLDVVHLAVHGRGDPRRGGRASLLFAADGGECDWTEFTQLTTFNWQTRLVVLSGCGTGVSGALEGHHLVGSASAAMEAGASTVLASLWPVGDEACKVFMVAFYQELKRRRRSGAVDLRPVVDQARNALRDWLAQKGSATTIRRDGRSALASSADPADRTGAPDTEVSNAVEWGPFILLGDPIVDFRQDRV